MYKKLAVAIIHGMGDQRVDFAEEMGIGIRRSFSKQLMHLVPDPSSQLIIRPIQWSTVFADKEQVLFEKMVLDNQLDYKGLRKFILHNVGDVIAYQQVEEASHNYDRVHKFIGEKLHEISLEASDDAPLCVVSHSLGSVVASNYFYDLQFKQEHVRSIVSRSSPLEKGDTLALFYTMGTTLPLWSLRYHNFSRPINIPSNELQNYYPGLDGEWINFFDTDDVLGYPLKDVDEHYYNAVNEDRKIHNKGLLTGWNPLCHNGYFTNKDVIDVIVKGLVRTWKQVNQI